MKDKHIQTFEQHQENIINSFDGMRLLKKEEIEIGKKVYIKGDDNRGYLLTIVYDDLYRDEDKEDAIEGDIRIEKNQEGVYEWTKSCWDSGREPSFQPGKESVFVPEKETYKNRMKIS